MSATDKREDSTGGGSQQPPKPSAFSFLMPVVSKKQQLRNLGGLRDSEDIGRDADRAGWLMSPAYMAFKQGGILEPTSNENRLANAALHSEFQSEDLQKQASQTHDQASQRTLMMQSHGFHNEAVSYARLDQDIQHRDDESRVFPQVKLTTAQSFRQPDAVIVPPGGLGSGVVIREMKTRELDQRSREQLGDIVGLMNNPQHSPPTMEIQGKGVQTPITALEVEMRSSSKDLSHDTLGFMQGLGQQTAKPVLMRTQSMSDFRPIEDVIQRHQVHHS